MRSGGWREMGRSRDPEAYKAGEQKISNVSISGEPVQLLTGDRREALRHEELSAQEQRDNEMSSMKAELDERLASPELLSDEAMADVTFGTQLKAFRATAERVAISGGSFSVLSKPCIAPDVADVASKTDASKSTSTW